MGRVGKFLIARPTELAQGYFARTVVYIYEDTPKGSAGVVINRPGDIDLSHLARERGRDYPRGLHPVYRGGPVNQNAIIMIHTEDFVSSNTLHTGAGINVSSDELMIQKLIDGNTARYFRLCAGASLWAPGQLDFEIAKGYWLTGDLPEDRVFSITGDKQWELAIDSLGQQFVAQYF